MIWAFTSKFCPTLFNPVKSVLIKNEFLYETLIGKWVQKSPNGYKKAQDPTGRKVLSQK